MANWKRLPFDGRDLSDERYRAAREKLLRFHKKRQSQKLKDVATSQNDIVPALDDE